MTWYDSKLLKYNYYLQWLQCPKHWLILAHNKLHNTFNIIKSLEKLDTSVLIMVYDKIDQTIR
jgi:hypothetical protein